MHSFAAFAWAVQTAHERFPETADGRRLSYLPLAHVAERLVVEHVLLAVGSHIYFTESLETFAADLQRARPTSFFSVPRLWLKFQQSILARMPAETLDRLLESPDRGVVARQILTKLGLDECTSAACSAAPMPPELLRWYARLGLNITEGYGMTEVMATHTTAPGQEVFGTVGLPFPGVDCRLDPSTSEIQIKCPATMLGYYQEPELTGRTFTVDGWLRTGDKGAFDAAGNLKITGRVKDLFKTSKGKYVAPAPIEDKLMMHVAVEACCVTGAGLGQPIALLMLNELACQNVKVSGNRVNLEVSLGKHMESINSTLEAHERLHCLVALTEPWSVNNDMVTPTLKVKRSRVEDTYGKYYEAWTSLGRPVVWHEQ
jgi:long-chain acyl-CoA synthetase